MFRMALSKAVSPDDRTRFFRLGSVIIEELTPVLQDVLTNEISPSLILNTVKQKNFFKKLQLDQIDKINDAQTQGYKDFDITLLYTLLRNLCPNIQEPTKGWGISEMPDQGEVTLGDDIERIRLIRNNVYGHISVLSVSETEFKEHWSTIYDICNRMQAQLGKYYVQRLQIAEGCTIDSAREKMYMDKMKDLIEDEKSIKEVLQNVQRVMKEIDPSSQETVRIETKNPAKRKFADALTESSIYILNDMVNSIHEKTTESEIEQLYESIEAFIREDNEESSRLASDPFFRDLTKKITTYSNFQEENKMKILARFLRFNLRLKKNYTASLVSSEGSLLLRLTFTSERGYYLYRQDLERGQIGKQILEVLLYPPYLASFDLKAEDLVVYLNDHILTKKNGEVPLLDDTPSSNQTLGEKTCVKHEDQHYILHCQQCQLPVCVDCIKSPEHKDHNFTNIKQVFNEKLKQLNEKLMQSLAAKNHIQTKKDKMLSDVNEICSTMIHKSKQLHSMVDSVLQDNLQKIETYKRSMTDVTVEKIKIVDACISDLMIKLNEMAEEQLPEETMIDFDSYNFETSEMDLLDFSAQEINITDVEDLFGELTIPQIRHWESGIELDRESDEEKIFFTPEEPKLVLATSFNLPSKASHVSSISSKKAWVSDFEGNLYLTDDTGGRLQLRKTLSGGLGVHTVSKDGELIYIAQDKTIKKVSKENKVEDLEIIITKSWNPCCIHSCHSNGDLLIGILKRKYLDQGAMLKRYTKNGEERWQILFDNEKEAIYEYPQYITENCNKDVIVTDFYKAALVVTDHKGKFRFNYLGHTQLGKFEPNGISTDSQAHILVSDLFTNSVQVIDKDGNFLFSLLTERDAVERPFSLNFNQHCNRLWVGLQSSPRMLVYSMQYENTREN